MTKYEKRDVTRRYLRSYKNNNGYLQFLRQKLLDIALYIPSGSTDNSNKIAPRVNANVKRYVELSEQYDKLILELEELCQEVIMRLRSLQNPTQALVLFKKYVESKSLREIARDQHYSYDWVREVHLKALEDFYEIYLQE